MDRNFWLKTILTLVIIFGVTTVLFLYTSGYRLSKGGEEQKVDLLKTGMISAKSIPEGASVYLDDKPVTATNDTIPGITPGKHNLRIFKKGYVEWRKEVEVFPELVTDITAVLISQSPRLEPLTNTGARFPNISPSLTKLAYFSTDTQEPGIWIIPLSQNGLSIFKTNPYIVLKDTRAVQFSLGKSIEWSPDEKSLLIKDSKDMFYILNTDNSASESTSSESPIKKEWSQILVDKREDFIQRLEIPDEFKTLAVSPDVLWAPDDKKFLYTIQKGDQIEYRVYNMEKPIPVGEKTDNIVFVTNNADRQPKITWYADSFHLILVEGEIEKERRGTIYLIRIDGSNKTEIYNNTLHSDVVYSSPAGDKLIILTSFKSGNQTDLYTIGIR